MDKEIKDLLYDLGIDEEPEENDNGSYTIDIPDSNVYSRYASKLDKADFLELDDEASNITADTTSLQYVNDEEDLIITLLGDLDANTYKLVIRSMNQ